MPGFDQKSAQRIVRAVKTVERMGGGGIVRRGKHDATYATSGTFTGVAYVMGNKVTGLNSDLTKPWVKCVRSTRTAVEVETAPASPFPDDEEYYEKANTFGDIHAFSH